MKKGKNASTLKIFFSFILGITVSATGVYAVTKVAGSDISFTSKYDLTSTNVQDAIKEVYNRTKVSSNNLVCKRATTLHTETCNQDCTDVSIYDESQSKSITSEMCYCIGAGYSKGATVTYGKLGTHGKLTSGDAFDCDVNGDGVYDSKTERFYYVSDYFDTYSETFDDTTATLIYSFNTSSEYYFEYSSGSSNVDKYKNNRGPNIYSGFDNSWTNVTRRSSTRKILTETKGVYSTKAGALESYNWATKHLVGRLVTYQEISKSCNIQNLGTIGELDNCNYLLENTSFTGSSKETFYWLETVPSNFEISVYAVDSGDRKIKAVYPEKHGVRPVIDVPKGSIEY